MQRAVALVDCNNFFASCERMFRPDLAKTPVIVLSNNDGCIVARSNEAKALGIKMGQPLYQVKRLCQDNGVQVFSSNYTLYGDISGRIMHHLHEYTPHVEIYSIDEAFLEFDPTIDLEARGRHIRKRVLQCQKVPVSIGIAETKTLAKIAAELAKTSAKAQGVLNLYQSPWLDTALERVTVGDVWGVGRRIAPVLEKRGIKTAKALRDIDDAWVMKHYGVTLLRTVRELRGVHCIPFEEVPPPKKNIMTSRSFGTDTDDLKELKTRVANYAARTGEKLREDGLQATALYVFAATNKYRESNPQYYGQTVIPLPHATSNTDELIKAALDAMEAIYRPGYDYHKAGVMALETRYADAYQQSLLVQPNQRSAKLMGLMDQLNRKYGTGSLRLAAEGTGKRFTMQQNSRSPRYTTCYDELREVI